MKDYRFSKIALIFLFLVAVAWFIYKPGFDAFLAAAGSLISYIELTRNSSSEKQSNKKEKKWANASPITPSTINKYDDVETFIYTQVTKTLIDNPKLSGKNLWGVLQFYAKNVDVQFSLLDIQSNWFTKPLWKNLYLFTNKFLLAFFACLIMIFSIWATVNSETISNDIYGILIFCLSIGTIYGLIWGIILSDDDEDINLEEYSSSFDSDGSSTWTKILIKMFVLGFLINFLTRLLPELIELYLKSQTISLYSLQTALYTGIRLPTFLICFISGYIFISNLVSSGWKPKIWSILLRGIYYALALGLAGFFSGLISFGLSGASFNPTDKGGIHLEVAIGFVIGIRNFGIRESVKHFTMRLFLVADSNLPFYHQKYLKALTESHLLVKVSEDKFAFQNQKVKQFFIQQRPT